MSAVVRLTYIVDDREEEEVELEHMGHDLFRAEIPEQVIGSVITYQAHATDWAGNEGSSDEATLLVAPLFQRGDADNSGEFVPWKK